MRDPNRTKEILDKFGEIWDENNQLRFGQLVKIITKDVETDIFYIEDDKFNDCLEEYIENNFKESD